MIDSHQIQRLRFTPGQDLLARDFRDAEIFEALRQQWHVRAVHQAYGVNSGLRVELISETASGIEVAVSPGLAYDATGRELFLTARRTVAFTDSAKGVYLLVLRRRGELVWISRERLQPCDSVPLARIDVDSSGSRIFRESFQAPAARPLARPRIGFGSTTAGATAWQAEVLKPPFDAQIVSLSVQVDTRAAGFTRPPCYFAWLQGRILQPFESALLPPILAFHPSIAEERLTGFQLQAVVRVTSSAPSSFNWRQHVLASAQESLSVCWLGIQPPPETQSSSEVSHGNP